MRDATEVAAIAARKERTARAAMRALIESRSLSVREDEPTYPYAVAGLAWKIADAMDLERGRRARNRRGKGDE